MLLCLFEIPILLSTSITLILSISPFCSLSIIFCYSFLSIPIISYEDLIIDLTFVITKYYYLNLYYNEKIYIIKIAYLFV